MKRTNLFLGISVLILSITPSFSDAAVHHRYVRLVLDESQISQFVSSSGLPAMELNAAFSEPFVPAKLTGTDILTLHVEFFDQQGNQLYLAVRDLGGGYLNARGHQWFQVAIALDQGTVEGSYSFGWGVDRSLPTDDFVYGSAACCSINVGGASVIEASFGFDLTNATKVIETARFIFNFGNPSLPAVITDGGGFNRMSLKVRSESLALVRKPRVEGIDGPSDDNGNFIDVDGDGSFFPGKVYDRKVAVGYSGQQHFMYIVNVFPSMPGKSNFSYPIFLPDGVILDPLGEENFDGCSDGTCDGLSQGTNLDCKATISVPSGKKNAATVQRALLEIGSEFSGTYCGYKVHIATAVVGKGRNVSYWPTECKAAESADGSPVYELIGLTNGVQVYDRVTDTLLPKTNAIELEASGCP